MSMSTSANSGLPLDATRKKPAADMTPDDWAGLINGLIEFFAEEAAEPEHAEDDAADTKPLYVNRPLKNADALIAWAKSHGFKKTLPATEMHCTIAYSKAPVDWGHVGKLGGDEQVPAAKGDMHGQRSVEQLGDKGAIVLRFESPELQDRWRQFKAAGASWDHDAYRPHVTFTFEAGDVDIAKVEPYTGELVFGPEEFVELKAGDNWSGRAKASMVGDAAPEAAGIQYTDPAGNVLLLKRSAKGDHQGEWAFPGGRIEPSETPMDAAIRESMEEIGREPKIDGGLKLLDRSASGQGAFHTFQNHVTEQFTPKLNEEHTDHVWAHPDNPPAPLHPGVANLFAAIGKGPLGKDATEAEWWEHGERERDRQESAEGNREIVEALNLIADPVVQDASREAEHTATIRYNGDFPFGKFLRAISTIGDVGHSFDIVIDPDDRENATKFGWDGDGADRIVSAEIDGADILKAGAHDAEFTESDHPRDQDGKFGSGSGGGAGGGGEHDLSDPTKPAFQMSKISPESAHSAVKAAIKSGAKPKVETNIPKNKLLATQGELKPYGFEDDDDVEGEGAAPFPGYEDKPVILKDRNGNYHVLDGHNRISAQVRGGKPVSAYVFSEASAPAPKPQPRQESSPDDGAKKLHAAIEAGVPLQWAQNRLTEGDRSSLVAKYGSLEHAYSSIRKEKYGHDAAMDADSAVTVDATHDGPWMSCMSTDGKRMYRNRSVPDQAEIDGKTVRVDPILLSHEVPERKDLETILKVFKEQSGGREPDPAERKVIYAGAHGRSGEPGERAYLEANGIDREAWNAWCRGIEAKIEKGPFENEPDDADVKPIPHTHNDLGATDSAMTFAFDRDSVREFDRDGRMKVKKAHISRACVNPYIGHEIPGWEELGLDSEKIYKLLRDPDELKKAAPTFNGIQLLKVHKPVSIDDHQPYEIVGTTGSETEYNHPYLDTPLFVWTQKGLDLIESEEARQLSCGYHYRPDMTPGTYEGEHYDGVMRDIVGNHVALVGDGRAGPNVIVGDGADAVRWRIIETSIMEAMV